MHSHRFFYPLIISTLLFISLGTHAQTKTLKVEAKPNEMTLYYSGTIQPLTGTIVQNINADGIITKKYFDYGTRIEKSQILFEITSTQLAKDYQDALTAYAKAKKTLSDVQYQVEGEKELNKLNIVSKQEYMTSQTQLFNAELDYEQAKRGLFRIMEMAGVPKNTINNLNTSDSQALKKALMNVPHTINIVSPMGGVALFPQSTTSTEEPTVGTHVKANDPLVLIHNKMGIAIHINVSQLDITRIRYDNKALITSDAFPGLTLIGQINVIDREATKAEFGGLPTFGVRVIVPTLTPSEYNLVLMGMSSEVALKVTTPPVIKVPLTAVHQKDNTAFVSLLDPKTNEIHDVAVTTGNTDLNSVEIVSGLKSGDEVVLNAADH